MIHARRRKGGKSFSSTLIMRRITGRLDIQPRNNVQNFIDARRIASSALIYRVSSFELDKYHVKEEVNVLDGNME